MGTLKDTVAGLNRVLDERAGHARLWEARYSGEAPISFLSPKVRTKLQNRLTRLNVPFDKLIVDSIVQRLNLSGFVVGDKPDTDLWSRWADSAMDDGAEQVMRDALITGAGYASVWVDAYGTPTVWPESSSQCAVRVDPFTRRTTLGLKRWVDPVEHKAHAILWTPTEVRRLVGNSYASADSAIPPNGWTVVETLPNPLGAVPLVQLLNVGRVQETNGASELAPTASLIDAVSKLATDLMVTAEEQAAPSRWITGFQLPEDDAGEPDSPFSPPDPADAADLADPWERGSTVILEDENAKVGQLPGSDLAGFERAVALLVRQIAAAAALPPAYLGLQADQALSADAVRAAESALVAKCESKMRSFGRGWSEVASLLLALEHGGQPQDYRVEPTWRDPATRSEAQAADAATKLHQSGLLSREGTLAALGYSPSEIAAETRAQAADAVRTALVTGAPQ